MHTSTTHTNTSTPTPAPTQGSWPTQCRVDSTWLATSCICANELCTAGCCPCCCCCSSSCCATCSCAAAAPMAPPVGAMGTEGAADCCCKLEGWRGSARQLLLPTTVGVDGLMRPPAAAADGRAGARGPCCCCMLPPAAVLPPCCNSMLLRRRMCSCDSSCCARAQLPEMPDTGCESAAVGVATDAADESDGCVVIGMCMSCCCC